MALNYTDQYIQSILSYLDYVNFKGNNEEESLINENLADESNKLLFFEKLKEYIDDPFAYQQMQSSLEFFTSHFEIVKQDIKNFINGFSATTYKLKIPIEGSSYGVGELFVSYRGTQST